MRGILLLALLAACSGKASQPAGATGASGAAGASAPAVAAPAKPRPIAPWLADFDVAAATARFDAVRTSASLRCLIDRAARDHEDTAIITATADEAPPVILRAIGTALAEHPAVDNSSFSMAAITAGELLERGHTLDGRILLESSEAKDSLFYAEHRAGLGMPYDLSGPRKLHTIIELALAGRADEANRAYDEHIEPAALKPYEMEHHVEALVTLGRVDAAKALLAAEPTDRAWLGALRWMRAALRSRREVPTAIDVLLAARAARGEAWTQDGAMVTETLRFGRGLGLAAELAPLRRRLITDLTTVEHGLGSELVMAYLADEVIAHGDPAELELLEPALVRSDMNVWRQHVAAVRALHTGTLDETLAAVLPLRTSAPPLWIRLWVRHAAQGFDPGFEQRLTAAACAR